ncbi:flagellar protein FlgN [Cohnella yongneupensis]|uniref:Flagellar protein FlgN n=1 Tax=Cohnella yongneupensis TaxID=425006 RepID=A0ABW0QVH7_9BACL
MDIRELCEALETMVLQHDQLIVLAERKKEALIGNDINVLNEVVNKESRLVKLVAEAENRRQKAVVVLLSTMGLRPQSGYKLADLIRMVTNAEDKLKLTELAERLSLKLGRLKNLGHINSRLTQQAIDFNDFSLSLLTGVYDDQDYVYKKPSDTTQGKLNLKMFDSRA